MLQAHRRQGDLCTQQVTAVKSRPSTPHAHSNEEQYGGTRPVIRATLDGRRGNGRVDGSGVRRVCQVDHGQRHRHPYGLSVRQRHRRPHRCRAGARGYGQPGDREPDPRRAAPLGREPGAYRHLHPRPYRRPLQSGGYAACCTGSSLVVMPGYHRQKMSRRSSFNTCVRTWRSKWVPRLVHCICCFFTNRLLIT